MGRRVLVIGDMHLPWVCTHTLKAIYSDLEREDFTDVVQMGDLYDFFSFTRFARRISITPEQELTEAHDGATNFWENIRKRKPKARCHLILGNHDVRPLSRILEKCPELRSLIQKGYEDLFRFKGVETLFDTRDDLEIDGVAYEHGYFGRPGQHLRENMMPTVIGHTHRPWIHYEQIRRQLLWEANAGYAADPAAEPLSYPRKKWVKWVRGRLWVLDRVPQFHPTPFPNAK